MRLLSIVASFALLPSLAVIAACGGSNAGDTSADASVDGPLHGSGHDAGAARDAAKHDAHSKDTGTTADSTAPDTGTTADASAHDTGTTSTDAGHDSGSPDADGAVIDAGHDALTRDSGAPDVAAGCTSSSECAAASCSGGTFTPAGTCVAGACVPRAPVACATMTPICDPSAGCVQCNDAADCPATGNACVSPVCSTNVCGTESVATGTSLPPAQQTSGDCQEVVCDGAGGTMSVSEATNLPSPPATVCLVPTCSGTPLAPSYTEAPTGTDCTVDGQLPVHLCGLTGTAVGGTCVECNVNADCAPTCPAGATCACDANRCGATFVYTAASQTFVVPMGVTQATVVALGASGGVGCNNAGPSGVGGSTTATIAVTEGEILVVVVGGAGTCGGLSGFNGGGSGTNALGASGGDASDVRQNGANLSDRVVVAAGGGGGYYGGSGGLGPSQGGGCCGPEGGLGASQSAGGAGGTGGFGTPGSAGMLGIGGAVGASANGGGGGGGGYYGGGGGTGGGGGGGGSSYADPAATNVVMQPRTQVGNGQVVITW